jgi:hypothetical protein
MKRIFFAFLTFGWFSLSAQECPHYEKVMNVYRRDKNAIDQYAKDFITDNQELFLYKQTSYLGNHKMDAPANFVPYSSNDSGIIANAVYIHSSDTLYASYGFFSKNNRTKVILISVKNYHQDATLREFMKTRTDDIISKYHSFLKSQNGDSKNW